MDYLQYIGGLTGVSALTGLAAATLAYYFTRPSPEVPLVPLHNQSPILEVSFDKLQIAHSASVSMEIVSLVTLNQINIAGGMVESITFTKLFTKLTYNPTLITF